MNLLLDTHTFLWFLRDDPQVSVSAKTAIMDPANRKLISTASCWEIAIKVSMKKLDLGVPFRGFIEQEMQSNNFESLLIEQDHLSVLVDLPFYHRDPFDRLLVAQAIWENIPIVSSDLLIDKYPVKRLW